MIIAIRRPVYREGHIGANYNSSKQKLKLVSWCFKPSQPQRITSGLQKLKTDSLFISYVIMFEEDWNKHNLVSQLVGALSPVNHRGFHQG